MLLNGGQDFGAAPGVSGMLWPLRKPRFEDFSPQEVAEVRELPVPDDMRLKVLVECREDNKKIEAEFDARGNAAMMTLVRRHAPRSGASPGP